MKRSWERVVDEARSRFGAEPFTTAQFVEVLRPHVNPMEAARTSDLTRVPSKPDEYESRRKDEVSVGLTRMANQILHNRRKSGKVVLLGGGVFRFSNEEEYG